MPVNRKVNCVWERQGKCYRKPFKKFLWIRYRPACPEYNYFFRFPYTDCQDAEPIPRPSPPLPQFPPRYPPQGSGVQKLSNDEIQNLINFMEHVKNAGISLKDIKDFKSHQPKEKFKYISKEEK